MNRSVSEPDDAADDGPDTADAEGEAQDQDSTSDNQTLIRLLEHQEKVCNHISGVFLFLFLLWPLLIILIFSLLDKLHVPLC